MPEDRLPRRCYNRLLAGHRNNPSSKSPNWVGCLAHSLAELGFSEVFDEQNAKRIAEGQAAIVATLRRNLWLEDMRRAATSSYSPYYHHLIMDANYLHNDVSLSKLRLISQVRVSPPEMTKIYWKGHSIKLDETETRDWKFC